MTLCYFGDYTECYRYLAMLYDNRLLILKVSVNFFIMSPNILFLLSFCIILLLSNLHFVHRSLEKQLNEFKPLGKKINYYVDEANDFKTSNMAATQTFKKIVRKCRQIIVGCKKRSLYGLLNDYYKIFITVAFPRWPLDKNTKIVKLKF